jgi:hypothetical protein
MIKYNIYEKYDKHDQVFHIFLLTEVNTVDVNLKTMPNIERGMTWEY